MQQLTNTDCSIIDWGGIVPSVVLGLCTLVGVPGNGLVVWIILKQIRRATFTVKMMLNLALADILTLITLPFWIYALLCSWKLGGGWCRVLSYVVYCSMYASVLTITLMSVHRSFMVLHPQCKQGLNWARQRLLLAAVWALACLLASPVIAARDVEKKDGRLKCLATVYKSGWKKVSLLLLETLAGFVLPYMVLATSYFCISRRVSRMARPKGKRLWKLIMWIVLTFFVFWLPYHAFNILHVATMSLTGSSKDKVTGLKMVLDRGSNIAGALAFINSCINPFLYALASRSLRGRITYISIRKLFRNSTTAESHALDSRKALNQHDSQNTQTPCPIRKDEL